MFVPPPRDQPGPWMKETGAFRCLKGRGERWTTETKTRERSVDRRSGRTNETESHKLFPQLPFSTDSRSEVYRRPPMFHPYVYFSVHVCLLLSLFNATSFFFFFPSCCPPVFRSPSQAHLCQLMAAERRGPPGWWALLAW